MCIIAFKPKGIKLPKEKILKNCFSNNPDGTGIAIQREGKIIINKFMEEDPFIAYHRHNARKEDNIIYHFRIATHGEVNLQNNHPFIITKDWKEMGETYSITEKNILAHNGIISSLVDNNKQSDSKILAHLLADEDINKNLFKSVGMQKLIKAIIDTDRLIVMGKNGNYFLLGTFEKSKGIYYSNFSFRYKYSRYTTYYNDDYYYALSNTMISDKQIKENKIIANENINCCKVKNQRCAYCNTEKDVYYYWDIEENLCQNCYHLIYEVE